MKNIIKTEYHLISSDDILSISKLTDKDKEIYGIEILFKNDSKLRICNNKEAIAILNIYEEKSDN